MAFARENGAAFPDISYGFYPVFADLYNINAEIIPLEDDFSIDYKKYLSIGKMVVIANPNAPTGKVIPKENIEEIIKSNPDNTKRSLSGPWRSRIAWAVGLGMAP